MTIEKWQKSAPKLTEWMEENIREGLTVFQFPEEYRKKLRTNNPLERVNKEIKRRIRVVSIFPNEASCLRLVSAILREISEEWETGKRYLNVIESIYENEPKINCMYLHCDKRGTTINLFMRDLPRLSVDIDLVYLPLTDRNQSLKEIEIGLLSIKEKLEKTHPELKINTRN